MNKKILIWSLLMTLMLIVPLTTADEPRDCRVDSCIAATDTDIIELTRDELSQLYDALSFIKEQDPALYITVEQALNDAVTLTADGSAILDVEVLEDELEYTLEMQVEGQQAQEMQGQQQQQTPSEGDEEPVCINFFMVKNIDVSGRGNITRGIFPIPWRYCAVKDASISIKSVVSIYYYHYTSGKSPTVHLNKEFTTTARSWMVFSFFSGTATADPETYHVEMHGSALIGSWSL